MNTRWKWYKRTLIILLSLNIMGLAWMSYQKLQKGIPDYIRLSVNEVNEFHFAYPVLAGFNEEAKGVFNINNQKVENDTVKFTMSQPFTMKSTKTGNYEMDIKLFGLIHFKKVQVDVVDSLKLMPSGIPIGIYVETDGLLVLGTGVVPGADGLNYEPALNVFQSGDYIKAINGKAINSIEEMQSIINETKGDEIQVKIRRNGETSNVRLKPVLTVDGDYKIGAWIRQDTQGIGTMSYVSEKGEFGALGHGIADSDTGLLLEIEGGTIYQAEIMHIVKGEKGKPGELVGFIDIMNENIMGKISTNSKLGIYGQTWFDKVGYSNDKLVPVAYKQEIELGKASIKCQIDDTVQDYEVEIVDVDYNNMSNKGLLLKITDERLLSKTGGIVQGMSGSPILQNGKLIGAVTHVLVQDSTKGYGTFIENMLRNQ